MRLTARTHRSIIRRPQSTLVLLGFKGQAGLPWKFMTERDSFDVLLLMPSGERFIKVGREEHIWDAAFAAGIVLPAMCHQGYCLTCAARLEDVGEVDQSDSLVYFPEDREGGFVLPCTGRARSDVRIKTHQQKEMRQFRKQKGLPAPYSWDLD
jgi:ferredoxin